MILIHSQPLQRCWWVRDCLDGQRKTENEENNTTTESLHHTFKVVIHLLVPSPFPAVRCSFIPPFWGLRLLALAVGGCYGEPAVSIPRPAWGEAWSLQWWQGGAGGLRRSVMLMASSSLLWGTPSAAIFPTQSYVLLVLHWSPTPFYIHIYCIRCVLNLLETCSFSSSMFQKTQFCPAPGP